MNNYEREYSSMRDKKLIKKELIHAIESVDNIINSLNQILSCNLSLDEITTYTNSKNNFVNYKERLTKELIELE